MVGALVHSLELNGSISGCKLVFHPDNASDFCHSVNPATQPDSFDTRPRGRGEKCYRTNESVDRPPNSWTNSCEQVRVLHNLREEYESLYFAWRLSVLTHDRLGRTRALRHRRFTSSVTSSRPCSFSAEGQRLWLSLILGNWPAPSAMHEAGKSKGLLRARWRVVFRERHGARLDHGRVFPLMV